MQTRRYTITGLLAVVALSAAAGFLTPDGQQPAFDMQGACAGASPFSRSVVNAFPTAEAGFARRRVEVEGR